MTVVNLTWSKILAGALLIGVGQAAAEDIFHRNDAEGCAIDQRSNEIVITCNEGP